MKYHMAIVAAWIVMITGVLIVDWFVDDPKNWRTGFALIAIFLPFLMWLVETRRRAYESRAKSDDEID